MTGPRVGLIARADNRGLGHLTWEFHRALAPAATLVVDLGDLSPFPNHLDRYPGATVAGWGGVEFDDERLVRSWLEGLDVVYTAETPYDWRLFDWCRDAGVASVLHAMPELFPASRVADHPPTQVWAPTSYRADQLEVGPPVVQVPVPIGDRPWPQPARVHQPLRVLHVAGRRALQDRNGTTTLLRALRWVTEPVHVTITIQEGQVPAVPALPGHVTVEVSDRNPTHYWELYDGFHVLVLPRRYGGLCLPVAEAAAAGMPSILPATSPNHEFPTVTLVPCRDGGTIHTPAGHVPIVTANERALAAALDHTVALAADDFEAERHKALCWARDRSWAALAQVYQEAFLAASGGL